MRSSRDHLSASMFRSFSFVDGGLVHRKAKRKDHVWSFDLSLHKPKMAGPARGNDFQTTLFWSYCVSSVWSGASPETP